MKKTLLFLMMAIGLVHCKTTDPTLDCLIESTSEDFERIVELLEKTLLNCGLVNDNGLDSFRQLVKRSITDRVNIRRCLNDFKIEPPSLSDIYALEECCRSLSDIKNDYCSHIIQMKEDGISESTFIGILIKINEKHWYNNIELRGTIEFLYFYMMSYEQQLEETG